MKHRTLHFIAGATILAFVAVSCSKSKEHAAQSKISDASQPAVELKIKWTPGKKIVQRMEIAASTETGPKNQQVQQSMTVSWDYSITPVKQLGSGGCEVELEFVGAKLESKAGEHTYTMFDSKHDDGKESKFPMATAMRKLVGAKLHYTLGRDNTVERLNGYDDFMVRIARGSKMPEMLKVMFNEAMLKRLCSWGDILPDHPVRPGDSWKYGSEMNLYGMTKMAVDGTFTFKNWEDYDGHKCVKLDYEGTIAGKKGGAARVSIESGKVHGSSWFDPEQGIPVASDSDQTMTLEYQQHDKSMSQAARQTITMRLLE